MSLLKLLLLEASRKDILVNKMGLNEKLANDFLQSYGKKRGVLYADFLRRWQKNIPWDEVENIIPTWREELDRIDYFLSSNNKPKDLFNIIKKGKFYNSNLLTYKDEIYRMSVFLESLTTIRDYVEATNTSISDKTLDEADTEATEWHENLEASGEGLELDEDQDLIHTFEDGYYWVDLNDSDCGDEGGAMGHCGRTSADTLLSLRDPNGEPHVTVAFNRDGTYTQMKGKKNEKPVEKYWKYCIWLFTDKAGDYEIDNYESEYRGSEDFKLMDYQEKDPELVKKLLNEKPKLQNIASFADSYINGETDIKNDEEALFLILHEKLEYSVDEIDISGIYFHIMDGDLDFWASKDDTLKNYLGVIEDGHVDIYSEDITPDMIEGMLDSLNLNDTKVYNSVKEAIEKSIEEELVEMETVVRSITSIGKFEDWDDFILRASPQEWKDLILELYRENDQYETALDIMHENLMSSQAFDEIYDDVIDYVGSAVIEYVGDLEIEELFLTVLVNGKREIFNKNNHALYNIIDWKEHKPKISTGTDQLLQAFATSKMSDEDIEFEIDRLVDYVELESSFSPPYYGYPNGIASKELVSDLFMDYFYEELITLR